MWTIDFAAVEQSHAVREEAEREMEVSRKWDALVTLLILDHNASGPSWNSEPLRVYTKLCK